MIRRIAATTSLLVFAVCLIAGLQVGNSFSTTVWRALIAMGFTALLGLIIGAMAQKMLEENLKEVEEKSKNEAKSGLADR
jgi:uncharacterized membrane protein YfcA